MFFRGGMPAKKAADKKDAKKEGPDITVQVRKIKIAIAQVFAEHHQVFPPSFLRGASTTPCLGEGMCHAMASGGH